jgi:hypothetical protein
MRSSKVGACLSVALALGSACASSSPSAGPPVTVSSSAGEATPSPTDSPTRDAASGCPNEADVTSDPSARIGGTLHGDVDGDGSPDDVLLAFDDRGALGCQAFLVVEGSGESAVLAIESFDRAFGLPQPRLNTLAEVDTVPGSEVAVDLVAGASTQFIGLFTMTGGELARVEVEGDEFPTDDLFPYGGSVGHVEASDCAGAPGTIVISAATPRGDDYQVTRRFFRFRGSTPTVELTSTERDKVAFEELGRFPEYRSSPFGGC